MIYILIVLWFGQDYRTGNTALAVEFSDQQSCLAAAETIRKQSENSSLHTIGTLVCTPKGKK